MKKILVLSLTFALSGSLVFAANSYTNSLKNAVKQDIQATKQETKNYKKSLKDAVKKDIETKKAENTKASEAKKAEKIKQLETKIAELKKEKTSVQKSNDLTNTEKTIKANALDKQINFYNKQLNALK